MTKSELHAVMSGGFATIAGSVMAAYISFGVSFFFVFGQIFVKYFPHHHHHHRYQQHIYYRLVLWQHRLH